MPERLSPTEIWYVYILRCADQSLYTGISKDIERRIQEHNHNNRLAAKYTRARRPVTLIYQETCGSKSDALKREFAIKKLGKLRKEALVTEGFHSALSELSIKPSPALDQTLEETYLPLARWCMEQRQQGCLIIGINGAQGSGKSTLSYILTRLLEQTFNQHTLTLSIDDLYKSHAKRQQMARRIHPLLKTRGVPGTHHTQLGIKLFNKLKQGTTEDLYIPRFNKAVDNPYPKKAWSRINKPVDILFFEGWCVAATAEDEEALLAPVNSLEREQDPHGYWRQFVNQQLKEDYNQLFSYIDKLIHLQVPSFEQAREWRLLQEQKLKASTHEQTTRIMSDDEIHQFMMHYERITRHCMKTLPTVADIVLEVNEDHLICIRD